MTGTVEGDASNAIVAAAISCGRPCGPGTTALRRRLLARRLRSATTTSRRRLNLVPYAVVDVPVDAELEVGTNVPQAAVLADGGVILIDEQVPTAYLVGRDGSASTVALDVVPKFIVATPGPVVYGLEPTEGTGLEFVAVSLTGLNAGQVVARQPVADPSLYLELPVGTFGNTADGVVDRVRQPGAVMIGHVDVTGAPVSVTPARCGRSTPTAS